MLSIKFFKRAFPFSIQDRSRIYEKLAKSSHRTLRLSNAFEIHQYTSWKMSFMISPWDNSRPSKIWPSMATFPTRVSSSSMKRSDRDERCPKFLFSHLLKVRSIELIVINLLCDKRPIKQNDLHCLTGSIWLIKLLCKSIIVYVCVQLYV